MRKITENALLFRVNQLKEKMAMFEEAGTPYKDNANGAAPGYKPYVAPAGTTATTTSPQPQMSPVQPQSKMNPVQTQGTQAQQGINNMLATPAAPSSGDAAKNPNGTNQDTAIPSGQAAPAPAGTKFPTTPAEIQAFQKAHGLKVDGLIGPNTLTALAKAGIQPPAGFKMAGAKQHPAPAPHPAQQGAAAKPAQQGAAAKPAQQGAAPGTVGYVDPKTGAVSSGDAERDERIAQAGQVAQMTPAQQHMFNQGAADQDEAVAGTYAPFRQGTKADLDQFTKAFAGQTAPAKAPIGGQMQSTGDPVKDSELANQGNTIVYKEDQDLARIVQLARW
jgi:hypothetical protein